MADADPIPNFANQSLSCADFMTKAQMQNPHLFPCPVAWLANKPWPIADQMTTREIRTNVINAKTLITLLDNTNAKLVTLRAEPQTTANAAMILAQTNIKTAVEGKMMQAFGFIPTLAQYVEAESINTPLTNSAAVGNNAVNSSTNNSTKKDKSNNFIYMIISIIAAIVIIIVTISKKDKTTGRGPFGEILAPTN